VPEPTIGPSIHPDVRSFLVEDGPTFDEVERRQRPENTIKERVEEGATLVRGYLEHEVKHKAIEHTAHLVEHSFGAANLASKISLVGTAFLTLQAAYEITEAAYDLAVKKPMEKGKELGEGGARDRGNLTLLMVVTVSQPDLLPDGYFLSESSRILHTDGKANLYQQKPFIVASSVLGKAVTDPELARSRDILVASTREGVSSAYQFGIDSDAALERWKSTDANFRTRYESDPAFRAGVQSVVWQAKMHRDEYDAAAALNGGYRGTPTRM
jgi:hypothetical protein